MKTKSIITIIAAVLFGGSAFAADDKAKDPGVPKDYPLKKCVISGEEIGGGGMTPFKVTHEGTDVWLCCKGCKKKFDADPAKFTKMVKDAAPKK